MAVVFNRRPRLSPRTKIIAVSAAGVLAAGVTTVALADTGEEVESTTSNGTLCGASFLEEPEYGDSDYQDAYERVNGYYGLESVRLFYSELPKPWPGKLDAEGKDITVSFKAPPREILNGDHDEMLRQWFAEAPTDRQVYWAYFHEPEDNVEKGEFTAEEWRGAFERISGLADEAGGDNLVATPILMAYTPDHPDRDWRDYVPDTDAIDVLAWDGYNTVDPEPDGYMTPEEIFGSSVEVNKELGVPYAVAEMGSGIAAGDDGTERAAWLSDSLDYLTSAEALWVQYFDVDYTPQGHADYRLRDDDPGQAVFKEFCES